MSKRNRERGRAPANGSPAAASPEKAPETGTPGTGARPGPGRIWAFRLTAALVVPLLALAALEGALRLGGFGYPTCFFLPSGDDRFLTTNRKFCWQYYDPAIATEPHPLLMAAQKPPGARRIFILGESAAEGTPDPAFGFARILEVLLDRTYPQVRWEVVNAAVRGVNSHIILPIARECAREEPDLFILYMGNNEAVGLHAPTPGRFNLRPSLTALRLEQWVKSTRLAQLTSRLVRRGPAGPKLHDMEYFRRTRLLEDDPRRQPVYENFRENLGSICDVIRRAGAKTILSTVAVNLRDCPPLGSLHRPGLSAGETARWEASYTNGAAAEEGGRFGEAARAYEEAARIDDHFADLQYRLARSLLVLGETNQAKARFSLARDWDALQFRSDSRINATIRETAAARAGAGARLLDEEKIFASDPASLAGGPGAELFRDDVHFTFEGDYLVASSALPEVVAALGLGKTTNPVPSRAECAAMLAFTPWDECNVLEAMSNLTTQPPFLDQLGRERRREAARALFEERRKALGGEALKQCARTYMAALKRSPEDWQLHLNFGGFWTEMKQPAFAAREYGKVVAALPRDLRFKLLLAYALRTEGRSDEAAREIEAAARIDPSYGPLQPALEWARGRGR